jgi:hypothetical protein
MREASFLRIMEALDPMVDETAKVEEEARLVWGLV